jgi:hypothetical protein
MADVISDRYKASGTAKAKKVAGKRPRVKAAPVAMPEQKSDPKVAQLQQRLATARKKLEDTKAAGKPTRALEDRIYEIEDALRLAGQTA